ncbi:Terminase [Vibrio crassostreae]|nr:Terminase [Vibrio crassostreae]CAK3283164.1 Terminase [Vibrio crassostreae]CAK3295585.1 Terminase [Vibrio crassostreae]CAK3318893.1 Terminase [Vibrio crassostreae]CAK3406158.1 Terminase [Vibrio crassostreae]
MSYGITSRDYLQRAKTLRAKNDIASLFYAVFELRCGIEVRMKEYLDAQRHISEKKKKGWKIAELARNIEDTFRLGEKKAIIQIVDASTQVPILFASYTPVRKKAHKVAQKLGNYMHCAKQYYSDNNPHWDHVRGLVDEGIAELQFSTSGNLLGPPMKHPKTGEVQMSLENNQEKHGYLQSSPDIFFRVDYE